MDPPRAYQATPNQHDPGDNDPDKRTVQLPTSYVPQTILTLTNPGVLLLLLLIPLTLIWTIQKTCPLLLPLQPCIIICFLTSRAAHHDGIPGSSLVESASDDDMFKPPLQSSEPMVVDTGLIETAPIPQSSVNIPQLWYLFLFNELVPRGTML